ncbi:hypothetical protein WJX74_006557 [Apatococcus lobatus]|uniref:Uncharacterized protein n=1 Tax=Apatococcus lobatus TaxID=904363 RepID=A0AAW1RLL1_9CHLO
MACHKLADVPSSITRSAGAASTMGLLAMLYNNHQSHAHEAPLEMQEQLKASSQQPFIQKLLQSAFAQECLHIPDVAFEEANAVLPRPGEFQSGRSVQQRSAQIQQDFPESPADCPKLQRNLHAFRCALDHALSNATLRGHLFELLSLQEVEGLRAAAQHPARLGRVHHQLMLQQDIMSADLQNALFKPNIR